MTRVSIGLLALAAGLSAAAAQSPAPYAGQQNREIKALSTQEIDDLRHGRGMGFAKSAELNDFPGPSHVIELAAKLDLTPDQLTRAKDSFERMKAAAIKLGDELIEAEKQLDRRFAHAHVDPVTLESSTREIGRVIGALRQVHLAAHLEMRAVLEPRQIERYAQLRGYRGGEPGSAAPHSHKH